MRIPIRSAAAAACLVAAIAGLALREAWRMPVVRHAAVALPHWPAGGAPITVAIISDVHIGNLTMDAARLTRIVDRVNALHPDLVVIAGDFIAGHEPGLAARHAPALVAPLRGLVAPLGRVAVMGNHDHWTGASPVHAALDAAGIATLDNSARRFGALTVVGIDDRHTRHDRIARAMDAARRLPGPRVIVSHGPDIVPALPRDASLVLAGHTHCGQIVLPLVGPPIIPSNYGRRYACGLVREAGRATIVTAGLGTSMLPLRFGAPPDLWLVRLTGDAR